MKKVIFLLSIFMFFFKTSTTANYEQKIYDFTIESITGETIDFKDYKNNVDVVIDQVHGLPFLTPLYVKNKKIIMYIHEVAGEIWTKMYPFPIGTIGRMV